MQRIDDPSAAPTLPSPLSTVAPGYFRRPSILAGDQGTIVTADFLNDVQENLVQVILDAGLSLSKGNGTKLRDAIAAKIGTHYAVAAGEAVVGHARFSTPAEILAGTLATAFISPLRLKEAFPSFLGNPGYIEFPTTAGKVVVNFGVNSVTNSEISVALGRAYATSHILAMASADTTTQTGATGETASARPHPSTPLTHISIRNNATGTFPLNWLSIGI